MGIKWRRSKKIIAFICNQIWQRQLMIVDLTILIWIQNLQISFLNTFITFWLLLVSALYFHLLHLLVFFLVVVIVILFLLFHFNCQSFSLSFFFVLYLFSYIICSRWQRIIKTRYFFFLKASDTRIVLKVVGQSKSTNQLATNHLSESTRWNCDSDNNFGWYF